MRLGLNLGYAGLEDPAGTLELVSEAEDLGYDIVWAAEAYGYDAPTVLAWLAGRTSRIGIGSAVMQIPARTPAATAMTAVSLDTISAGRFRLGLGVSGPQVSEGWHGVRFDDPLGRTREYVGIVRRAVMGEPVKVSGAHWTLPLPDGPGKALRLSVRPVRPSVPVYLAAVGPRNLSLAGEVADGWLGVFFAPELAQTTLGPLRDARRLAVSRSATKPSDDGERDPFDIVPTVPVVVDDDVDSAADPVRGYAALYLGGMGSRSENYYNALARRMGYEKEARLVQDLYLDRRYADAAAAVPRDFLDATSLLGPADRIRDRLAVYAEAGVSTLSLAPFGKTLRDRVAALRTVADALDAAGLAGNPR